MLKLDWKQTRKRVRETVPTHSLASLLSSLYIAEQAALDQQTLETFPEDSSNTYCGEEGIAKYRTLLTRVINHWTTLPVPTDLEWKEATLTDPDTNKVLKAIENGAPLNHGLLSHKGYYTEWAQGKIEAAEGILYQWEEPKLTKIRQLKRRIVPIALQPHICAAYHSTPLAGHVGLYKTYWRIATRYWWPGMYTYVRQAVLRCGHCIVGNNISHSAQQILYRQSQQTNPLT
jgi:hypothetical protein